MRNWTWLAVGAIVASAGCGGAAGEIDLGGLGEHAGPDAVCAECKITGGGQLQIDGAWAQFSISARPAREGSGFGGVGIAAIGTVRLHEVPASGGGVHLAGQVDTILACGRAGGILTATVAGALEGGGRFQLSVTDGGEPANDAVAWAGGEVVAPVAKGNIQVHQLASCEGQCPPGQCRCAEYDACGHCCGGEGPPPGTPGDGGDGGPDHGGGDPGEPYVPL